MIVVTKHTGQLCNQIWSLLPIIAFLEEKNHRLIVFNFEKEYVDLFPNLKYHTKIYWFYDNDRSKIRKFIKKRIIKIINKILPEYVGSLSCFCGIARIDGWSKRHDHSYITEHKTKLHYLFKPQSSVDMIINNTLDSYDGITVGVHVRRGDYRSWCGGKYYFTDEIYYQIMIDLANEAKSVGKNIRFLVCSNEQFNIVSNNENLNIIQMPNSSGIVDLYALSKCDYIVAPPSSYSQWASFYGNVPLKVILNPTQRVKFEDFSPISYLDTFSNGNVLTMDEIKECFYIS